MHIHDYCAEQGTPTNPHGMPFGTDDNAIASGLRKLADQIDAGKVTAQQFEMASKITADDFTMTVITITLMEPKRQRSTRATD